MSKIIIKPHHLLDIFKLYGRGIEHFVPDPAFHHDFYSIANMVVDRKVKIISFTSEDDDICKLCKFLKEKKCNSTFILNDKEMDKHLFNKSIDLKLLEILNLQEGTDYPFDIIVSKLQSELTQKIIDEVWHLNNKEDNCIRYSYTRKGIEKYCQKI